MRRARIEFIAAFTMLALPLAASRAQSILPGVSSRVRIVVADSGQPSGRPAGGVTTVTGVILSRSPDTLQLAADGRPGRISIPAARIVAIDESDGMHRHVGLGAAVGFGVGAALGAAMGYSADMSCSGSELGCAMTAPAARSTLVVLSTVVVAAVGTGVGALFGAASHVHWRPSSRPLVGALVSPGVNGTHVGLALNW